MDAELILYCSDACGRVHARAPLSVHPVAVVSDPLLYSGMLLIVDVTACWSVLSPEHT